jgi:hypothetical protein
VLIGRKFLKLIYGVGNIMNAPKLHSGTILAVLCVLQALSLKCSFFACQNSLSLALVVSYIDRQFKWRFSSCMFCIKQRGSAQRKKRKALWQYSIVNVLPHNRVYSTLVPSKLRKQGQILNSYYSGVYLGLEFA